jgi:DNA-binding transcriptional LysR family regulator
LANCESESRHHERECPLAWKALKNMNFRTLDLNLLRVFDMVMVERNVTRAANQLAMTQPAVSNALRRLREAIGEELFVPGPTGVTPTPQADALWPAVRSAMARLREVFDPQGFDPAHDRRGFTLTMADATAAVMVPPLVDELERACPGVDLRVEPLTSRDPRPQLERGVADAAIGFFPDVARALAASAGRDECQIDALYGCDYVCVMRRGHALAHGDMLTLDDYCAARHVRVSFAGRPRGFVDEALAALGRTRHVVLTVNHYSTAAQVVQRSDLLTVFPRSYVPVSGVARDLVVRDFPEPLPRIEIGLLWHRRHERDPGHRWLRGLVARVAAGVASASPPAAPGRTSPPAHAAFAATALQLAPPG